MTDTGSGAVHEKEKGYLDEIIRKVNGLFEGELSDNDQLVVNGVLMGKLLENETLVRQAATNSKEQFANSPDLADALMNAIMDAFEAHTAMSSQALGSERVREGLKDTLLGPAQLYEALRARGQWLRRGRWGRRSAPRHWRQSIPSTCRRRRLSTIGKRCPTTICRSGRVASLVAC
jgi:hypothetical protein